MMDVGNVKLIYLALNKGDKDNDKKYFNERIDNK